MRVRMSAGALAVFALAACGGQTKPVAETSTAPVSSANSSPAVVSPAVAPAKGEKPAREFVIGKWGTDGDCQMAIDLRPDGTSDGPFGNWAYSDGAISFPEEPDFKVNVTIIDDNTMKSTNATSDKPSTMTRCP